MFTPRFGVVKGKTEAALLELSNSDPNLNIYNARPGGVDASAHLEIQPFIPKRSAIMNATSKYILPAFNTLWPDMMSPTQELGRALTDLATGDGKVLEGKGVSGEGRTLGNVALRTLARL